MSLQVSSETAPAGGSVQIKVTVAAPALISTGSISMDLDPAVFGAIASVAVFSATGDQIGYANVNTQHMEAHFSSPSGGVGQLPGLPVLAVSVPVLSAVMPGAIVSLSVDASASAWTDPQGNAYSVTANPGKFTVGGRLSVVNVTPGGGLLPQDTVLEIRGTGFQPGTAVSIDGVALSAVRYVAPDRIDVTLGGATEMTGKHMRVANGTGPAVDLAPGPAVPIIVTMGAVRS